MAVLKLLGILDIVIGIVLASITKFELSFGFLFVFAIILFIKSSLGMLKDFGSWIDFLSGVVFILSSLIILTPLHFIFAILLIQKGIFSLF